MSAPLSPTQDFKAGLEVGKRGRSAEDAERIRDMHAALLEARAALLMLGAGRVVGGFVPVETAALRIVNRALKIR